MGPSTTILLIAQLRLLATLVKMLADRNFVAPDQSEKLISNALEGTGVDLTWS